MKTNNMKIRYIETSPRVTFVPGVNTLADLENGYWVAHAKDGDVRCSDVDECRDIAAADGFSGICFASDKD